MNLTSNTPTVYLLHFRKPYRHARHYLGFSTNLDKRITEAGIDWKLVRTWPGDRELERRLKKLK